MKYGIQLPIQAQTRLMAAPWESEAGPREIARIAQACDAAGFDYVGVCDHIGVPRSQAERMQTTWYDTVATLSWLAGITETVRLLSHVYVVPYRHPLATAKAFSTLDALSDGRAILGVGAGHVAEEFAALGIDFASRGRITDDYLPRIRAAFESEWPESDIGQRPRPVQPGGPPIWVGGSSVPALRRAARLGDGWLPQGPPEGGLARAIEILTEHRPSGTLDGFTIGGGLSCYLGTPSTDVPDWTVHGSDDRILEAVAAVSAQGVTHAQVRIPATSSDELIDQITQFGERIVPATTDV